MIDKRRHYILVLDTETANTLTELLPAVFGEDGEVIKPERTRLDMSSTLVYDCGWAVADTHGNIYETASYVNRDIFNDERDLMRTAYYADKIPIYVEDLRVGRRTMANTWEIRQAMLDIIEKYGIEQWAAYNARFDQNSLNNTQRYHTGSKWRYWFPYAALEPWDILKMARDVVAPMPTFQKFCVENGFIAGNGKPSMKAETVYSFIIGNPKFKESHTGLEDVLIEVAIMAYCFRQHKPMRKALYDNPREFPESTDFQRELLASLKQQPTIRAGLKAPPKGGNNMWLYQTEARYESIKKITGIAGVYRREDSFIRIFCGEYMRTMEFNSERKCRLFFQELMQNLSNDNKILRYGEIEDMV